LNKDEALGLFDETLSLCKESGFSPNIISQPGYMQTLITETAASIGVAIAPFCVGKLYSQGFHFLNLEKINMKIPLQLQYNKNNQAATIKAFVDIALNAKVEIQQSMKH
jgi:hypothetical protein